MTSIYSKDDKVEFIFTTFDKQHFEIETHQISLNIYFSIERRNLKKHFYLFLKTFFRYNLANNKREIKKINYFGKNSSQTCNLANDKKKS